MTLEEDFHRAETLMKSGETAAALRILVSIVQEKPYGEDPIPVILKAYQLITDCNQWDYFNQTWVEMKLSNQEEVDRLLSDPDRYISEIIDLLRRFHGWWSMGWINQLGDQQRKALRFLCWEFLRIQTGDSKKYLNDLQMAKETVEIAYRLFTSEIERNKELEKQAVRKSHWLSFVISTASGLATGLGLCGFAWIMILINRKVTYWDGLASLVNIFLPALIIVAVLAWATRDNRKKFSFPAILFSFLGLSAVGGILGVVRAHVNAQGSTKDLVISLIGNIAFNDTVDQWATIVMMVLFVTLALFANYNFFRSLYEAYEFSDNIKTPLFFVAAFAIYIGFITIDGVHFTPWLFGDARTMAQWVNRFPLVMAAIPPTILGAVTGFLFPTRKVLAIFSH